MARHSYEPQGVCSGHISFEIDNGILKNVRFDGGCSGNLKAIARLVEGMPVADVIQKIKGIECDDKGTSCADQLANALAEHVQGGSAA